MSNTKHTPEIAFSTLKQGAADWTDEHSVNILDDKGRFVMKAQVNVYFDPEKAAENAAEIVRRYNTQPELLKALEIAQISLKEAGITPSNSNVATIVENAIKAATE